MIDVSELVALVLNKGDKPGHAFRGNQWTRGGNVGGGGGVKLNEWVRSPNNPANAASLDRRLAGITYGAERAVDVTEDTLAGLSIPSRFVQQRKQAVREEMKAAKSMFDEARSVQEARTRGSDGRSMTSVKDRNVRDMYATRCEEHATNMLQSATAVLEGGDYPYSRLEEMTTAFGTIQEMAQNLQNAARSMKRLP